MSPGPPALQRQDIVYTDTQLASFDETEDVSGALLQVLGALREVAQARTRERQ
jgi:hypothetical protein